MPASVEDGADAVAGARTFVSLPRRTSPLIRSWFGFEDTGDGRMRVNFVWEPLPRVPGSIGDTRIPARVALRVSSPDGTEIFAGAIGASGPGPKSDKRAAFHAPSGSVLVEMRIEDDTSAYLDSDVRDVVVPPAAVGLAWQAGSSAGLSSF
jgi:hypothetical protein